MARYYRRLTGSRTGLTIVAKAHTIWIPIIKATAAAPDRGQRHLLPPPLNPSPPPSIPKYRGCRLQHRHLPGWLAGAGPGARACMGLGWVWMLCVCVVDGRGDASNPRAAGAHRLHARGVPDESLGRAMCSRGWCEVYLLRAFLPVDCPHVAPTKGKASQGLSGLVLSIAKCITGIIEEGKWTRLLNVDMLRGC